MRRQSEDYHQRFEAGSRCMERYVVPDVDHFDILNVLGDQQSELVSRSMDFIRN